eukprot:CAMPEP_0172323668 /NCGR_PEP_ID=MMETSP1058-20130122/49364_1 /TAXON_ID=83371 /ORGANISM="Detonula confervacea, Strain CCMP 353" /LENGTH=667 /DNA_ID=CAMNT_0013039733 /DNA_START=111 /DNA_END=2114 /DNA_ORIENTATION=-
MTEMIKEQLEKFSDIDCECDETSSYPLEDLKDFLIALPSGDSDDVKHAIVGSLFLHHFIECVGKAEEYGDETFDEQLVLQIVEILLQLCPECASVRAPSDHYCYKDAYPLHLACSTGGDAADAVIKLLLKKHPVGLDKLSSAICGIIEMGDDVAGCPLHFYINSNCNMEVIKLLVDACPVALTIGGDNMTPLHLILHERIDTVKKIDVVKFLVESDPSVLRMRDIFARTPIHLACMDKYATVEVVKYLHEMWPDSINTPDNDGLILLHYFCLKDTFSLRSMRIKESLNLAILKYLLDAAPETVRERCFMNELPIHIAARHQSPEFCKLLVEYFPGSEREVDEFGHLPLSKACVEGCLDTVKYFLTIYPASLSMAINGMIPLHATIDSESSDRTEIIQYLLELDPSSASTKAFGMTLPLHLACVKYQHVEAVKMLVDLHPEAVMATNSSGKNALALVRYAMLTPIEQSYKEQFGKIASFLQKQLIFVLKVENDDGSMMVTDDTGRLLLHNALQDNGVSLGVVKLIVQGNQHAVQVADVSGMYPLHVACTARESFIEGIYPKPLMKDNTIEKIKYIAGLDEIVLERVDGQGRNALHLACIEGNCRSTEYLLGQFPSLASQEDNDNRLPIHLLCDASGKEHIVESRGYIEAIWKLLLAHPQVVLSAVDTP